MPDDDAQTHHSSAATATSPLTSPVVDPPPRAAERVAFAREQFHSDGRVEPGTVRSPILASWTRSRDWAVPVDNLDLPFAETDRDSRLVRGAHAVIDDVVDQFTSEPVSVILTDEDGVVLDRRTGDTALQQHLDKVWLAPGFSYAERYVGTNGIGTALEGRGTAHVFGHEHYIEHLEDLACAGAPIHHPTTGKLLGVIDLTCWRRDASQMMVAAAATIARRIEETLLDQCGQRELAVLQDYLAACRRNRGAVLALSDNLLMMNDRARELIDPADQAPLIADATEALSTGRRRQLVVDLPSGAIARVQCKPSWNESGSVGGILQVQLMATEPAPARATPATPTSVLPTLVGSGALWTKCLQAVDRHFRAGEWLVLEGEPGVGKLTVAKATHQARNPAGHLRVIDAAAVAEGMDGPRWLAEVTDELVTAEGGTLVLAHIDRLPGAELRVLGELLQPARESADCERPWVVATRNSDNPVDDDLAELLPHFPRSVLVPPLRHHVEDVADLVPFLIGRTTRAELTCSAEAMRVLMRNRWPGNVEQLHQTVRKIVARRRRGLVTPADLPPDTRVTTRRVLTPLEAIECDAIVDALIETDGNKAEAARHLGMSRATIYRKIRGYGISMSVQGADARD